MAILKKDSKLSQNRDTVSFTQIIMKKYLIPFMLGFIGMVLAHIIILLGFGLGVGFPIYFISYLIVFSAIYYFLTLKNPQWWLSNSICLFFIPFLYWYILLLSDGKFSWKYASQIKSDSGMILILPINVLLSTLIAAVVINQKKSG